MQVTDTEIPGVVLFTPHAFRDHRGYFFESWRAKDFSSQLKQRIEFVQGNISGSVPFTLRGLHYQVKRPVGKLIHCLRGSIYDVAVDIRRDSPTFGKHVHVVLDDVEHKALWVPPGFAHGFLAGPAGATVAYECTDVHVPEFDRSIHPLDLDLAIIWPLSESGFSTPRTPVMSDKDRKAPSFREAELL